MNLNERIKRAQNKISEISNKINEIELQKGELVKELLRQDGIIRELNEIAKEEKPSKKEK